MVHFLVMFYPEYQHGHPECFDISVRSTTQPSCISSSASSSAAAAAAGEVAKNEKHLHFAAVERVGSDIFLWFFLEIIEVHVDTLCPGNFVYVLLLTLPLNVVESQKKWPGRIYCKTFSTIADKQCKDHFVLLGFARPGG